MKLLFDAVTVIIIGVLGYLFSIFSLMLCPYLVAFDNYNIMCIVVAVIAGIAYIMERDTEKKEQIKERKKNRNKLGF